MNFGMKHNFENEIYNMMLNLPIKLVFILKLYLPKKLYLISFHLKIVLTQKIVLN